MFFTPISKEMNDDFSQYHQKGHLFQSSQWAAIKKCWHAEYIGGFDDKGKLILSCVLLTRTFTPFKLNIGYTPRGPVCDYGDLTVLHEFINYLRSYCKKNHLAFIVFDPDIPVRIDGLLEEEGETATQFLAVSGVESKRADNFEMIQANSVFRVRWNGGPDKDTILAEIFQRFDKKTRYNIRVAQRRNLKVEIYDPADMREEQLQAFCNLMELTGQRDHFVPRDRDYFSHLLKSLGSHAKMFLIKYDPEFDLTNTQKEMTQLSQQLENCRHSPSGGSSQDNTSTKRVELERKLKDLQERCDRIRPVMGGKSVYLSGSILAIWGEKSWYLYGASSDVHRDTMPNYLMQWSMIQETVKAGCHMYDLRGIPAHPREDNPLYGLYRFKKGFGGNLEEFPGEFFLVNNRPAYWIFSFVFSRFKVARKFWLRLTALCKNLMELS